MERTHTSSSEILHQGIKKNVAATIIKQLAAKPEHVFLEEAGAKMTSMEFISHVANQRKNLLSAGVCRGDRICVSSGRDDFGFWIDLVSVWAVGAITVPIDAEVGEDQLHYIVELVEPKVHLLGGEKGIQGLRETKLSTYKMDSNPAEGPLPETADTVSKDTAAILFTSGSTGNPKGVVLSHRSILGNATAFLRQLSVSADDRLAIATPFHFTSAICHFLAAALTPAVFVATEKKLFKADLSNFLKTTHATCFGGAPIQLRWIAECAADQSIDLKWVMSSGDHLSSDVIAAFKSSLPHTMIYTVYGLTEVGGRLCLLPPEMTDQAPGSVGRPIDGLELTVRDEDGALCPAGTVGDIYVTGVYLFDGYYKNKNDTKEFLGQWGLKTGDVGKVDERGLVYLKGRSDDVFKTSGKKVSGLVISDALMNTGLFEDVAVMPNAHPVVGHVPYAFYVLRKSTSFEHAAVMRQLRKILPADHMPKKFFEVPTIPRTRSGKIIRSEMQALSDETAV